MHDIDALWIAAEAHAQARRHKMAASLGVRLGQPLRRATSANSSDDWRHKAACIEEDPELFFTKNSNSYGIEEAKKVCQSCEVRNICLNEAITKGYDDGVWGGLSDEERRSLKRRNSRAKKARL